MRLPRDLKNAPLEQVIQHMRELGIKRRLVLLEQGQDRETYLRQFLEALDSEEPPLFVIVRSHTEES